MEESSEGGRKTAVCRTCLGTSEKMASIFQDPQGVTFKDMLISFCTIQIDERETLSQVICKECSEEILRAYCFKLKCERSDGILREKFTEFLNTSTNSLIAQDSLVLKCEYSNDDVKFEGSDYAESTDFQIKTELDESDDDKDDVLSLADQYGLRNGKNKIANLRKTQKKEGKAKGKKKGKCKKMDKVKKLKNEETSVVKNEYKKIYECPKCFAFFKSFHMISKHMTKLHQITINSVEHYDQIHREAKAKTKIKDKNTFDEVTNSVSDGELLINGDMSNLYKCTVCNFTNESFEVMKPHIIAHRGEKYIACDECDYTCSDVRRLACHKLGHLETRPFPCTQCPYSAQTRKLLNCHVASRHSDEKPFSCHACDYTTKLRISLCQHIARRHEKRKEHACRVCGKRFFSSYHNKLHELTHGGDKPHVCEHCGLRFIQKSNLLKHVSIMHCDTGERAHPCPQCPYRARTKQTLRKHLMRHTGERPFSCDLCSFSCIAKSALDLHKLRHAGDKNFACLTCDYRCYSMDRLKAHERVHTGERPYACDLCSYRAKTRGRLKNHTKSHQNALKFSCQHCPYRANYRSNLVHHLKKNCGRSGKRFSLTNTNHNMTAVSQAAEATEEHAAGLQQTPDENQSTLTADTTHLKMEAHTTDHDDFAANT